MEEKLILVISKRQRFGWKFNIYWAREHQNQGVELLGTPDVNGKELQEASEIDRKLIRLIEEVSDASLLKAYSRQKKMLDFMEEVTQKTIDDLIRPRIELNNRRPASLVAVPKSLLHNWYNELKKFAPDLKVYIYAGNNRVRTKEVEKIFNPYQVVIIPYSLLRADIEYIKAYPFHYVVLDESQYIKNPDSILYQSIQTLSSSHKLILTGTPIENSLSDLWAQFNFINPGLLGAFSFFKNHYIQKIKEKDVCAEEALQKLIQPFFLRRTKEEVAVDLPPLLQEIVYCDMTESQQAIYESEKNRIRNVLLENKEHFNKNNF